MYRSGREDGSRLEGRKQPEFQDEPKAQGVLDQPAGMLGHGDKPATAMALMRRLFSKIRALRRLPGFHSLCLRRPLRDFEVATMVLSAVVYRRNIGPITLFADESGIKWANESGVSELYDDVIRLDPNLRVNQHVFWACSKIEAMSMMKAPCISLDIDAVLFRRPRMMTDVVALHSEPEEWEVYKQSPFRNDIHKLVATYTRDIPDNGRKTEYPPANTGVLCINDEDFRMLYVEIAKHAMLIESMLPAMRPDSVITIDGSPVTQMVLAEQYLLSHLAGETGKNLSFLGTLSLDDDHMAHNPDVFHLWNSKQFYSKHERAREAYISWAMENIWALGQEQMDALSLIVRRCNLPRFRVNDGNTRSIRWSHAGEWIGPGEKLENIK